MVKKRAKESRILRSLLYGRSKKSRFFNYGLLSLNLLVFSIFPLEVLYPNSIAVISFEIFFATIFIIEYIARLWIAPKKLSYILDIFSLIDLLVIISLLAPTFIGNAAILRTMRILRITRSYHVIKIAERQYPALVHYKDIVYSVVNLLTFLFMTTTIVFVSQSPVNVNINSYIDALYFTVATLTTTGYGDITAVGTGGKLLAVLTMIIGISLFFKLAQALVRGPKAHTTCPDCGLNTHDRDASHCKHCGHVIKIDNEGFA